jgi:hypothetical protein
MAPGWIGQGLEDEGDVGFACPIIAHVSNS